jgi:hypothetical protein
VEAIKIFYPNKSRRLTFPWLILSMFGLYNTTHSLFFGPNLSNSQNIYISNSSRKDIIINLFLSILILTNHAKEAYFEAKYILTIINLFHDSKKDKSYISTKPKFFDIEYQKFPKLYINQNYHNSLALISLCSLLA